MSSLLGCFPCYCGSGVEQLTRNEQVVGSNPTSSSTPAVSKSRTAGFLYLKLFRLRLQQGSFL